MPKIRMVWGVVGVASALAAAAPAQARVDQRGVLSAEAPRLIFEGRGSGVLNANPGVLPAQTSCVDHVGDCEIVLVELRDAGALRVDLEVTNQLTVFAGPTRVNQQQLHLELWRSDADGQYVKVLDSTHFENYYDLPTRTTVAADGLAPGFYLVVVEHEVTVDAQIVGTVTLTAAPKPEPVALAPDAVGSPDASGTPETSSAAPPPQPAAPARPAAQRARSRSACRKRALRIKSKRRRAAALRRCRLAR